jgi:transcriptional regulator with XRE-family HTH domain
VKTLEDNFLKDKRDALELSQQAVADDVKIDRSYYTKIENGLRPSVDVAQRIAKVLKFNWTIFFEDNCAINTQIHKETEMI